MEQETKILSIYERIQAIANDVMSIDKDMQVGQGNYAYKAVSDLSVTKAVKEAEFKHGVISIPTKQELINHEIIRIVDKDKERITYSFLIKMTVVFVNVDNPEDKIEVESFGHGLDSGDKGFGKASTYARKYALLNAYKIATGEDPDNEASKAQEGKKTISEKRAAVVNYLELDNNKVLQMCEHFNVSELSDLTDSQISTIYLTYLKKGLIQ